LTVLIKIQEIQVKSAVQKKKKRNPGRSTEFQNAFRIREMQVLYVLNHTGLKKNKSIF